jgi:hypothetical protein
MHFAKPILQSFSLFAVRRRVREPLANVVLSVAKALAMLPALPIVASLIPALVAALRAKSGYPRYGNLNVWPWRRTLSMDRRPRECASK